MAGLQEWLRPPIAKKKPVISAWSMLTSLVKSLVGPGRWMSSGRTPSMTCRTAAALPGMASRCAGSTKWSAGQITPASLSAACAMNSAFSVVSARARCAWGVPASNAAMRLLVVMTSFQGVRDQSHRRGPRAGRSDPLRGDDQLRRMAAPGTDPCQSGGPRSRRRKSVVAVSGLNC